MLRDYGIEVAIRSLYERITSDALHVEFRFQKFTRLEERIEFSLYRIIQELLNNILKHSKAKNALVSLRIKKRTLFVDVHDDGVGFNEKKLNPMNKGIGLQHIKNRVRLLEGTISIKSKPGRTQFSISIPLDPFGENG